MQRTGLTHMHGRVGSDQRVDGPDHTDQARQTRAGPAAVIFEVREDGHRRRFWGEHPERDENCKKADNMDYQEQALDEGQLPRKEGIEDDGHRIDGHDEQRAMVGLVRVGALRGEQREQSRDNDCDDVSSTCNVHLPAEYAKPT